MHSVRQCIHDKSVSEIKKDITVAVIRSTNNENPRTGESKSCSGVFSVCMLKGSGSRDRSRENTVRKPGETSPEPGQCSHRQVQEPAVTAEAFPLKQQKAGLSATTFCLRKR